MVMPASNDAQRRARIAERRARVGHLYLRCASQRRIAELCSSSPTTVRRDIAALEAEWAQEALIAVQQAKGRELMRIDRVENECWRSWDRSKGLGAKAAGDPAFLRLIIDLVRERAKLLALYAPRQQEVGVLVGQRPEWIAQIDKLSDEELAAKGCRELVRAHRQSIQSPPQLPDA